jgi:hypothetical protein
VAVTRSIAKFSSWIVIAILLLFIGKKLYKDYRDKIEIEENLAIVEGEIIDYYIVGTDSPYLTYKFQVGSQQYEKTRSVFATFMGCEKTKQCIGRKFIVYYSRNNPEKSEIDLSQEIK